MGLRRLPRPLRLAIFSLALGVLLYLTLAPVSELPQTRLWDKAQHAAAWFALTALGLALDLWRVRTLAVFTLTLGAVIELLQSVLDLGRQGDWRDVAADSLGVAAALLIFLLARRRAAPRAA